MKNIFIILFLLNAGYLAGQQQLALSDKQSKRDSIYKTANDCILKAVSELEAKYADQLTEAKLIFKQSMSESDKLTIREFRRDYRQKISQKASEFKAYDLEVNGSTAPHIWEYKRTIFKLKMKYPSFNYYSKMKGPLEKYVLKKLVGSVKDYSELEAIRILYANFEDELVTQLNTSPCRAHLGLPNYHLTTPEGSKDDYILYNMMLFMID